MNTSENRHDLPYRYVLVAQVTVRSLLAGDKSRGMNLKNRLSAQGETPSHPRLPDDQSGIISPRREMIEI
jgi:hypothetical protein